nr:MAG: DNA pilot protein [Microviridae sp.]
MPVQIESQAADDSSAIDAITDAAGGALTGGVSSIATQGVSALTNLIFGNTQQDKMQQQLQQQQALTNIQVNAQNQEADNALQNQETLFNYQNAYNTPTQQIARYEAAGLNPALMYQASGSGGATMPSVSQGYAGGGQAADAAQTQNAAVQNSMQIEQQKVMESQINLNNAQAEKISGHDVQNIDAQTENTQQDTQNKVAQQTLTEEQTKLASVQADIAGKTEDEAVTMIAYNLQTAMAQTTSALSNAKVDNDTINSKIKILSQQATNMAIDAMAKKQGIQVQEAQINQITQGIQQKWEELNLQGQNNTLQHEDRVKAINDYTANALKVAGIQAVGNIVNNITQIATRQIPKGSTTITTNQNGVKMTDNTIQY